MPKIPFGKPFPGIDSVSLRDGIAAGLVNGFISELGDFEKVPGHTVFATHPDGLSIDGLYETIDGSNILVLTNGRLFLLQTDGSFIGLTGPYLPCNLPSTVYPYCAEDGQHQYLAIGGS